MEFHFLLNFSENIAMPTLGSIFEHYCDHVTYRTFLKDCGIPFSCRHYEAMIIIKNEKFTKIDLQKYSTLFTRTSITLLFQSNKAKFSWSMILYSFKYPCYHKSVVLLFLCKVMRW